MIPAIEFKNITKQFGNLKANDNVSFAIRKNSVHCILGENGAGKSTLMKILYGAYQPDSGKLFVDGKQQNFHTPHDAINAGVAMVWQHFMLIDDFSVLENVILGNEPISGIKIDFKTAQKKINDVITKFNLGLNPDDKVEKLSIAEQQKVELLKILYRKPSIIIFDEPTAVLSPVEVDEFFNIITKLKDSGNTIILITHKLREVIQIAERVTVLRQGKKVYEAEATEIDEDILGKEIVGDSSFEIASETKLETDGEKKVAILEKAGLSSGGYSKLNDINLVLRAGEISGICGVEGNGQNEIVDILLQLLSVENGTAELNYSSVSVVPDDRIKKGMISEYTIGENVITRKMGFEIALKAKLKKLSEILIKSYDLRTPDYFTPMGNLSGGNQQKAIVAREIENQSELIIFSHPTRGVDLKSSLFIHDEIIHVRNSGRAVLLVSSDLDELFKLSDRLIVLYNGQTVKEYEPLELKSRLKDAESFTVEVGKLMVGAGIE